jgi:hypothetical protein
MKKLNVDNLFVLIAAILMFIMIFGFVATCHGKTLQAYSDSHITVLWYEDAEGRFICEENQIIRLQEDLWPQENQVWHTYDNADCYDTIGSVDTYCHGICQRQSTWIADANGLPTLATDKNGFLVIKGWWDASHVNETDHTHPEGFGGCPAGSFDPNQWNGYVQGHDYTLEPWWDSCVHHQSIHYYYQPGYSDTPIAVWYHKNNKWQMQYKDHWWDYMEVYDNIKPLPGGWKIQDEEVVFDLTDFFVAWLGNEPGYDIDGDGIVNMKDFSLLGF